MLGIDDNRMLCGEHHIPGIFQLQLSKADIRLVSLLNPMGMLTYRRWQKEPVICFQQLLGIPTRLEPQENSCDV